MKENTGTGTFLWKTTSHMATLEQGLVTIGLQVIAVIQARSSQYPFSQCIHLHPTGTKEAGLRPLCYTKEGNEQIDLNPNNLI